MNKDLNAYAKNTNYYTQLVQKKFYDLSLEARKELANDPNKSINDFDPRTIKITKAMENEIASNIVIEYVNIGKELSKEEEKLSVSKEHLEKATYQYPLNFDNYNTMVKMVAVQEAKVKNLKSFIDKVFGTPFDGEK